MVIKRIKSFVTWLAPARLLLMEEVAAMMAWLASEDCAFSTGDVFDISDAPDAQSKEHPFPLGQEYCHSNLISDPLG